MARAAQEYTVIIEQGILQVTYAFFPFGGDAKPKYSTPGCHRATFVEIETAVDVTGVTLELAHGLEFKKRQETTQSAARCCVSSVTGGGTVVVTNVFRG